MEEETKKFPRLRKYGYWIFLVTSILVLVLVAVLSAQKAKGPITQNISIEPETESFVSAEPVRFLAPLNNVDVIKNYSNSALQYSKTLKQWEAHKAIDFLAEEGTDVFAVLDGTITEVSYNYLMGNVVKLDVGKGLVVVYKSLANDPPVKVGDKVKRGDVIGKVSTTAKSEASDGPHLHLETWLNGENVDPNEYLDLTEKESE